MAKPGRPPHKPTTALRRKVAIAAGGGMTHEDIALALGITSPTLKKHYAHELSIGAHEKRLEVLEAAYVAAKGGKIAGMRLYLSGTPLAAAPDPDPDPDGQEKPVGKKAEARAAAATAQVGTEWEDLLKRPAAPGVQ